MIEITKVLKKYPKIQILIIAAITTIVLINESISFIEKLIKGKTPLVIGSLILFLAFNLVFIENRRKNGRKNNNR